MPRQAPERFMGVAIRRIEQNGAFCSEWPRVWQIHPGTKSEYTARTVFCPRQKKASTLREDGAFAPILMKSRCCLAVEVLIQSSCRQEDSVMMGLRKEAQAALFYEFNLEDHVPADHLVRLIDRFVDLSDIRAHLRPFYSDIGHPSIDPELMIRMLLIGYIMGIRSERRLCEEVHLNLAYRWFCRLDLGDPVPDQSTFSKNRHGRFRESDVFRQLFEAVVALCIQKGLVGGDIFAADASIKRADANKQNSTPK